MHKPPQDYTKLDLTTCIWRDCHCDCMIPHRWVFVGLMLETELGNWRSEEWVCVAKDYPEVLQNCREITITLCDLAKEEMFMYGTLRHSILALMEVADVNRARAIVHDRLKSLWWQVDGWYCVDLRPNDFVLIVDSDRVWALKKHNHRFWKIEILLSMAHLKSRKLLDFDIRQHHKCIQHLEKEVLWIKAINDERGISRLDVHWSRNIPIRRVMMRVKWGNVNTNDWHT
jgi:hypothetical protein